MELAPGPEEHYLIKTTDDEGDLSVGGGLGKRQADWQKLGVFIDVPSIDGYLEKVKVLAPKTHVPGFCWIATCKDTEGNHFGLLENEKK